MNDLKCYKVTCCDSNMNSYVVDVFATDEFAAKHCAEYNALECKNKNVKAIYCDELTENIK